MDPLERCLSKTLVLRNHLCCYRFMKDTPSTETIGPKPIYNDA